MLVGRGVRRLVLATFLLEVGVLLAVVPWTAFWDRNYFAQWSPWLRLFLMNHFVRGAVSGLGVVNIAVGLGELLSMLIAWRGAKAVHR